MYRAMCQRCLFLELCFLLSGLDWWFVHYQGRVLFSVRWLILNEVKLIVIVQTKVDALWLFVEWYLFGSRVMFWVHFHFINWSFRVRFVWNWWLFFTWYSREFELCWGFECSWLRCCCVRCPEVLLATWYKCWHTIRALLCYFSQRCIGRH